MAANTNFPLLNASKVASMWGNLLHPLVDEASLFVATSPTPGTAIATTTSVVDAGNAGATSAQTRPVACIFNGQGVGSNIVVYPLTLNMLLAQVPTSATSWQMAMWLEPLGATMVTSGGSTITPVAANQLAGGSLSKSIITFGAIVASATSGTGKLVCRRQINPAIPVTADQWMFTFGGLLSSDQVAGGAGAKNVTFGLPAIAIPPQWGLKIGMWSAANAAAPSWEFELQYAERGIGQ